MARDSNAGQLFHHVALDRQVTGSDGAGGTVTGWEEQFQCRAGYIHLKGGETVMAGRLEGTHTQIIRVRSSAGTRAITTDWRVRDMRDGEWENGVPDGTWTGPLFNIRDITPRADRAFLDLLCQKGVAT